MVGLMPFVAPVYAILIVLAMYFGIKIYVGRKKRAIENDVGQGLCIDCGSKIINDACPNCDSGE